MCFFSLIFLRFYVNELPSLRLPTEMVSDTLSNLGNNSLKGTVTNVYTTRTAPSLSQKSMVLRGRGVCVCVCLHVCVHILTQYHFWSSLPLNLDSEVVLPSKALGRNNKNNRREEANILCYGLPIQHVDGNLYFHFKCK